MAVRCLEPDVDAPDSDRIEADGPKAEAQQRVPAGIARRSLAPRAADRLCRLATDVDDRAAAVVLHLGAEDLAKLRVRAGGGPFTEAVFSLRLLEADPQSALGSPWLDRIRPRVRQARMPLAVLALVEAVTDLHLVATEAPSITEALHRLKATLGRPAPAKAAPLHGGSDRAADPVRTWLRAILRGDPQAVDSLVRLFLDYHRRAVQPFWRSILACLEAEWARCGRLMAEGGVEHLLSRLHPTVRWRAPLLEVARAVGAPRLRRMQRREPHVLGGRSLVLVPSTFCLAGPELLWSRHDPSQPLALVYPAVHHVDEAESLWAPGRTPAPSAFAKLLGPTRADALVAIADTCTTTGLARRVGVSPATASHHAGILRSAGLIISRRSGTTVVHRLSPLGAELIGADRR